MRNLSMNKKYTSVFIFIYLIYIVLTLSFDNMRFMYIEFVSSVFWYVGNTYFYVYLFSPLLLLVLFLFPKNNCIYILLTFITCYLITLLILNQSVEILYETDFDSIKIVYSFVSLIILIILLYILNIILEKKRLFLLVIVILGSVLTATIPQSFHLLDSIPRVDKSEQLLR